MGIVGVDHVQLAAPAGCEQQAQAFYGRLLGLEEIDKPGSLKARGGAWFRCGDQQLHIGIAAEFRPALKAHPGLLVGAGGLEELAERLEAGGAEVDWDTSLDPLQRFYTHDPWGNRIELTERRPDPAGGI